MANVQKTVDIVFGGKNEIGKVIDSITRDFDRFGGSITAVTEPLANVANKVLMLDAAIAALAAGAIVLAVQKAGEFGDSFKEIATLTDASAESMAAFRGDILAYAQESQRSLDDINQAVYKAISAGIDYRDVLGSLKVAEELSQAGRNDLASTTVLLAGTMNAYGASSSEAAHYADVFMETIRGGLLTLPEMAASLANVTGIAAMGKVPIETLTAALAAVTSTGIPVEQAVTGIKAALSNMITPSAEAARLANQLGIEFSATALATGGLEKILWDAWRATKGNSEEMATLFGSIRGLNVATVLASDSQGKFAEMLEKTAGAEGSLATASSKMTEQFSDINQNILNNIDVALISIGDRFTGTYSAIAEGLADVFKGVKVAIDAGTFDPIFNYLKSIGVDLANTLKAIGANLPAALEGIDFSPVIASLGRLGEEIAAAFETIFGAVDLTSVEGLHDFIQRLIDGFARLVDVTKGIVEGMAPLWAMLGKLVGGFESMDTATAEAIGKVLGVANAIQILADNSGILIGVLGLLTGTHIANLIRDFGRLTTVVLGSIPGFATLIASLGTMGAIGVGAGVGILTGTLLNQIPIVGDLAQGFYKLIDVNGDFFGAQTRSREEVARINREFDAAVLKNKAFASAAGEATSATGAQANSMTALGTSMDSLGNRSSSVAEEVAALAAKLSAIPEKREVGIVVTADGTKIETTKDMIYKTFPDGQMLITNVGLRANEASITETQKKIDEKIPAAKVMEIQAKIDEAKIKAQSEIVQKAIEWKAKVDIEQIKAAAETIKATFKSIDNTITSTGQLMGNLFNVYADLMSGRSGGTSFIEQQILEESRRRDDALTMQKDMTAAQVELIKQQAAAIQRGDALIQIDGKGLQPHLEAFMFEILSAIQIKANAEGMKFLVGV